MKGVALNLTRIGERARKEPGLVFASLYHHICDVDNLRACYDALDANKATGVDGVTKEEYGKNLEENRRLLRFDRIFGIKNGQPFIWECHISIAYSTLNPKD